jgi:hypothetical protein
MHPGEEKIGAGRRPSFEMDADVARLPAGQGRAERVNLARWPS